MTDSKLLHPDSAALRAKLAATTLPFFVARLSDSALEVGVIGKTDTHSLRAKLSGVVGNGITLRFKRHSDRKLRRARSLEQLVGTTGRGELVFDRTQAIGRAEAIIDLSQRLRAALGDRVAALMFEADRRTVFVVLSRASLKDKTAAESVAHVSETMAAIDPIVAGWSATSASTEFNASVRVGFEVPSGLRLIAVDRRTARYMLLQLLRRPMSGGWGKALAGALVGAAVSAPALAEGPAVDAPNISILTRGGVVNDPVNFEHLWAGIGIKATAPLGDMFGVQVDAGVGTDAYYGAALHLFTRDPSVGLVGALLSAESRYGVSMTRLGVEGEFYLSDNFTVTGSGGLQGGTSPNGLFGKADVRFYPDPNFMLRVGGEYQPTMYLAHAGFEWLPAAESLPGLSLFGDATYANTGDYRLLFGLNFQIGGSGALIDRHRRSDPTEAIFNVWDVSSAAEDDDGSGYGTD